MRSDGLQIIEASQQPGFSRSSPNRSMQSHHIIIHTNVYLTPILSFPPLGTVMPASSTPTPIPTHNLKAAFLFLRTASTAVTNLTVQIDSTKASIQSKLQNGHHTESLTYYTTQLETEQRDLKMWEARLVQAGVGVVNWAAKVRLGR